MIRRQGVAVGVQPRRGVAQQRVAGDDPVPVQRLVLLDHPDDRPGEVVVARLVEARHLGGLAARERHGVVPAAPRNTLDDARDLLHREPGPRDVIHERDRPGPMHQDVVHAVVDQVFADRVPASGLERHEDLGADPVGAEHQHRLAEAGRHPDHPAEGADLSHRERRPRRSHQLADPGLGGVGAGQVDAGGGVLAGPPGAHPMGSASSMWVRSRKPRTRRSTSATVTSSKPRVPNADTAKDPMVAPYTIARRRLLLEVSPVRAR
jgi:hypothetical protein